MFVSGLIQQNIENTKAISFKYLKRKKEPKLRCGFWHSKRGAKCELPRGRAPSSSSTSSTNGSQRKKNKERQSWEMGEGSRSERSPGCERLKRLPRNGGRA